MNGHYVEFRHATSSVRLALDLSEHLQRRHMLGMTVIVAERPIIFLSVLRKAWIRTEGYVRKQMASTLDTRRTLLLREGEQMAAVHFRCAGSLSPSSVVIIAPDSTAGLPDLYTTLYIVSSVELSQRKYFEGRLSPRGVIVEYGDWR